MSDVDRVGLLWQLHHRFLGDAGLFPHTASGHRPSWFEMQPSWPYSCRRMEGKMMGKGAKDVIRSLYLLSADKT